MKQLLSLAAAGFILSAGAFDITPQTPILTPGFTDQPEVKAVESLKEHLDKIFGRKMSVKNLKKVKNPVNAIILRRDNKLGAEEWLIKTEGKNLIISGGYPRGLYYAVHRFLENVADVRWFTPFETRIIKKSKIHYPDKKVLRGQPAFILGRTIEASYHNTKTSIFNARHCSSGSYGKWPSNFHSRVIGGTCHTFYHLTKDIPKDKEHLLPVSANGIRLRATRGIGPGQVCFSNKEFRAYAKEKIRQMIKEHQKYFVKYPFLHRPSWNRLIELSQNDNHNYCRCKGCIALEKKYGAISGAMLEFINDIAGAFPEYTFQTFAYHDTAKPPKGIKARDNVMIRFAFLASDILRPLSAPTNAKFREYYEGWDKVCRQKSIWCYHRLYRLSEAFPWPQACFWYMAEDFRYYDKIGAARIFDETELFPPRAFFDLHIYLSATLSLDPYRDADKLIEEFFDFQYGPAAPEMKAYAAYLRKRLEEVKDKRLHDGPLRARSYMDAAFLRTLNSFLDRAEAKAKGNKKILDLIALERVPVDYAAAYTWNSIGKGIGGSRRDLCNRLEKNMRILLKRYLPNPKARVAGITAKAMIEKEINVIRMLRDPLPIPPGMEKLDIRQISVMENDMRTNVSDPEAAFNTAYKFANPPKRYPHDINSVSFVCYDYTNRKTVGGRKIPPAELKKDEKYHLYYIGRWAPDGFNREQLRGHRSWMLVMTRMYAQIWDAIDPDREYDFYVSMKLTGPAYVKGSKKENAIWIDKLVIVKQGVKKRK